MLLGSFYTHQHFKVKTYQNACGKCIYWVNVMFLSLKINRRRHFFAFWNIRILGSNELESKWEIQFLRSKLLVDAGVSVDFIMNSRILD